MAKEHIEAIAASAEQTKEAAATASAAAQSSSQAATDTRRAARTTAAAAVATKSSAERTTELAADRTALALERTYAAWVRTGLVALASGIGARKLLDGAVPDWLIALAGGTLLLFSTFCFVAGVWRQLFIVRAPKPDVPRLPAIILIVVNACLALVSLAAFGGVFLWRLP